MSVAWSELGEEGQRRAEAAFMSLSHAAALSEAMREEVQERRPTFADLYAWATDPNHILSHAKQAVIATDPKLRRDLSLLLGRLGRLRAVAAAAASSGGLDARSGPGFTLRLTVSRADAGQTYIGIELDLAALPDGAAPSLLLVLRDGAPIAKLALSDAPDGLIQLLESSDGAAVRGLRAADTDLVLV
jgi:hypothetical protein